jgi:hypothetical protein
MPPEIKTIRAQANCFQLLAKIQFRDALNGVCSVAVAIENFIRSINVYETLGSELTDEDYRMISDSANKLAGIYSTFADWKKAIEYHMIAVFYTEQIEHKGLVAN